MLSSLRVLPGGSALVGDGVELAFRTDGGERRVPLTDAWSVPLESARPVRSFPSYRRQRHFPGLWCAWWAMAVRAAWPRAMSPPAARARTPALAGVVNAGLRPEGVVHRRDGCYRSRMPV
ncbi:hypothetical protein QTQ03_05840 [Micromonospora sp. WMMA1363]|uniref:hypothetical protein n=1 Tax=Micromonospora sp. WMMA1363 TaxID=3053985 RepID=UPI00259D0AB9|nr:hypothetical protein [Micromonospora sp. WMMA1363]MDM4719141.1 hypothetical protein [Micromonospora sp. WMMA1363]